MKARNPSQNSFSIGRGMLQAGPVVLCYLPVSFAIGVLASQTQFSLLEMLLLSALVYSGSGQSIGLQLLALGQPIFAIYSITFIINLRYFLMLAALAPKLSSWPKALRYLFALEVTDETFAIHSSQFRTEVPARRYVFAINLTSHFAWILGGTLGHLAGSLVSDVRPYGFDFAVPGMFIALLVIQIENRLMVLLAFLGGAVAIAIKFSPLQNWGVIVAGVLCATIGAVVETWKRK